MASKPTHIKENQGNNGTSNRSRVSKASSSAGQKRSRNPVELVSEPTVNYAEQMRGNLSRQITAAGVMGGSLRFMQSQEKAKRKKEQLKVQQVFERTFNFMKGVMNNLMDVIRNQPEPPPPVQPEPVVVYVPSPSPPRETTTTKRIRDSVPRGGTPSPAPSSEPTTSSTPPPVMAKDDVYSRGKNNR